MIVSESLPTLALLAVCAVLVGALIGSVGVGGVLLTPALTLIAGWDVRLAMATSIWAFVFAGVAGTASYARRGSLAWEPALRLSLGAIPGALVGAWANGLLPPLVLELALAVALLGAGLHALRSRSQGGERARLGALALAAIGFGVGFGSVLTGTGGPLLVVPVLFSLGVPALTTVGISQVAQLPVTVFGTLGFLVYGEVALLAGLLLGLLIVAGVLGGAALAHVARAETLRRAVAIACLAVGVLIGLEALLPGRG